MINELDDSAWKTIHLQNVLFSLFTLGHILIHCCRSFYYESGNKHQLIFGNWSLMFIFRHRFHSFLRPSKILVFNYFNKYENKFNFTRQFDIRLERRKIRKKTWKTKIIFAAQEKYIENEYFVSPLLCDLEW